MTRLWWTLIMTAVQFELIRQVKSRKNLHILTSLSYNLKLGSDIVLTGGAFAVAVDRVNRLFGGRFNVSLTHLYDVSHSSCDDVAAQATAAVASYYYRHDTSATTCYAIATSSCSDVPGLATISRGLDWPLFYNTVSQNDFLTPLDSPSTVGIGGSYRGYAKVTFQLLTYYKWYHVAFLSEATSVVPFYRNIGSVLVDLTKQSPLPFVVEGYALTSNGIDSISSALKSARRNSRVILLFSTGKTGAKILRIAAKELDVMTGEYVFITLQPLRADSYSLPSHFSLTEHDRSNEAIMNVFRSLVYIGTHIVTSEAEDLDSEIAQKSRQLYNTSYPNSSKPLDSFTVQASYDLVELLATVFNQSLDNDDNSSKVEPVCSGLSLARAMANNTFQLSTGSLFVNSNQTRNLDLDIIAFNVTRLTMQIVGRFVWGRNMFVWHGNDSFSWATRDGLPPGDEPLCGFSGVTGQCAENASYKTAAIVVPLMLILGLLLFGYFFVRSHRNHSGDVSNWWRLTDQDFLKILKKNISLSLRFDEC